MVGEVSAAENTVNKKMEVDHLLVKDLQQASYSDDSSFFHFSNSNNGFNRLSKSFAKA